MLFKQEALAGIRTGKVTLAFRRWRAAAVRSGGQQVTPVGMIAFGDVRRVTPGDISLADAQAAGYESKSALLKALEGRAGEIWRIEVSFAGDDPRIGLRENTDMSLQHIAARLDRFDRAAEQPWTRAVLALIASRPGVRAAELAAGLGEERARFKRRVRNLNALGLTLSLQTGYQLSPRGKAYLDALDRLANRSSTP